MQFICAICHRTHEGPPMAYRLARPNVGHDTDLTFFRGGELCKGDDSQFILANIEVPIIDGDKFIWTCWFSIAAASFEQIERCWESGAREGLVPAFAWLSNALPGYQPTTLLLKALVHHRGAGLRAWVEIEPTTHLLAREQLNGISLGRVEELCHAVTMDPLAEITIEQEPLCSES